MRAFGRYDAGSPLFSVHIPKCAGSSLGEVLRNWFTPRGYFTHYFDEVRNAPPQDHRLWNADVPSRDFPICVHGHFNRARGYGVEHYYPQARQLITVIREPFEMKVSNYYYVLESARLGAGGAKRSGAAHPIIAQSWDLTTYLREDISSHLLNFMPAHLNANNYKEVLESFFLYVGISERMETVVRELGQLLGFPETTVPIVNAAARAGDVDDFQRELFREHNTLACAIYDYISARFGSVH